MPPTPPSDPVTDAALRPALVNFVRERRAVLFVGAGLSRPAGYPSWRGLMEVVLRATAGRTGDASTQAELSALLEAGRYPELADQCREVLGRARFAALLREELGRPAPPPEPTHRAIVETPYAAIVTTNFDTLLEQAYARWGLESVPKAPTSAQLGRQGTLLLDRTLFILKAHGSIHDETSLVLTSEDYRRIIHANPAFQQVMAAILLTHAVIFVGYSLSDPNFRLLLESQLTVFGTEAPPRYALMEGVGHVEAQVLDRTTGIEVIPYPRGEHQSVARFLRAIADASRAGDSRRPRSRVEVLRDHVPVPALRVAIRPRDAMLDVEWFETSTDDLDGNTVPRDRRWMASATSLAWTELAASRVDLSGTDIHRIGALLGRPFSRLGIPLVSTGDPRVVMLDVPPELAAIPWEWMMTGDRPLCLETPVCRTVPGFDAAARGRPFFRHPLRVLLVGDALAESARQRHPLPGTREEVEEIRLRFRRASKRHHLTLLAGPSASYDRVLQEVSAGYDIVHLSGVSYVDDTGESVVPLHDGHVRASELATLLIRHPPGLLFVNEDCSAFVPAFGGSYAVNIDGTDAYGDFYHRMQQHRPGLERVVARAGVGTFVGCMAPAQERVAREVAVDFYQHLLDGQPVAHALYLSRRARPREDEHTSALFAMAGCPDARIVQA